MTDPYTGGRIILIAGPGKGQRRPIPSGWRGRPMPLARSWRPVRRRKESR